MDTRPEGVYCHWEAYQPELSAEKDSYYQRKDRLVIERVNGDGSVSTLGCTREEAGAILATIDTDPLTTERDEAQTKVASLTKFIYQLADFAGVDIDQKAPNNDWMIPLEDAVTGWVSRAESSEARVAYICTICSGPARWEPKEHVWRHAGDTFANEFVAQTFCDKYGYPIKVRALSAAVKGDG